jgi:hypothetical protein
VTTNNCPACKTSLIGDPIPEEKRKYYAGTHWRREIGIQDSKLYDGVLWWKCPDCNHVWKRFSWSPDFKEDE